MELCKDNMSMLRGKCDEAQASKYIAQLASAVNHCHKNGIIHRDIKLENVMLGKNNELKLIDFGLSIIQKDKGNDE